MKTLYKIFFILSWQIIGITSFAQHSGLRNHEWSFAVGIIHPQMSEDSPKNNLDFLNYFDSYPYAKLALGYKFDFLSKMSADIKLLLMSDLIPDNYAMTVAYQVNEQWGVGLGSEMHKVYITGFEEAQKRIFHPYRLLDNNIRQLLFRELNIHLTNSYKLIDNERFKMIAKADIGFAAYLKKGTDFYHQKEFSNEKLFCHYQTKTTFQPYIFPKLEFYLRVFKIKKTSVGLQLHSGFFYSRRGINYLRKVQKWTAENSTIQKIKTPKHNYYGWKAELGIFVRRNN